MRLFFALIKAKNQLKSENITKCQQKLKADVLLFLFLNKKAEAFIPRSESFSFSVRHILFDYQLKTGQVKS